MKNIITFTILTCTFLLYGCGDSKKNTGNNTVTSPTRSTTSATTVRLRAENMGNVSHIDFSVVIPSGTKSSLLDYEGSATIKGTIQTVPALACLARRVSFSCNAQLSVGNITASGCSMGGSSVFLQIILFRSTSLTRSAAKTSYDIKGIVINVDQNCYVNK